MPKYRLVRGGPDSDYGLQTVERSTGRVHYFYWKEDIDPGYGGGLPYIEGAQQVDLAQVGIFPLPPAGWQRLALTAVRNAGDKLPSMKGLSSAKVVVGGPFVWSLMVEWKGSDAWSSFLDGEDSAGIGKLSFKAGWYLPIMYLLRAGAPALNKPGGQWWAWFLESYYELLDVIGGLVFEWMLSQSEGAAAYRKREGTSRKTIEQALDEIGNGVLCYWDIARLALKHRGGRLEQVLSSVPRIDPFVMRHMLKVSQALWTMGDREQFEEEDQELLAGLLPIALWGQVGPTLTYARDHGFMTLEQLREHWYARAKWE